MREADIRTLALIGIVMVRVPGLDTNAVGAHAPVCTSREEVRDLLEGLMAGGMAGHPVVLAEAADL